MGWIILVVVVGIGWFAFRELKQMEAEILEDIARKNALETADSELPASSNDSDLPIRESATATSLQEQLLQLISSRPGLMQTEIYSVLEAFDRKQIQHTLLEMDRLGLVVRKRAKNSYQIFRS